jgi:xylulokinase
VVRAILEGVAFSLKDSFEILKELNVPCETIRLGGGGARSELWRQIQADVYGREVGTVEAEEGAAYGVAVLAGVAAGAWPSVDAACDAVIRTNIRVQPGAQASEIFHRQYRKYVALYPTLRSILNPEGTNATNNLH